MKSGGGNKDSETNVDSTTFALYRVMRARVMCLYEVCCGSGGQFPIWIEF